LLASARLHAEAVRTEADETASGIRKAAMFESQELLAAAERDIAALRHEVADQRQHVMAELKEVQESTNQTIQDMLGKASALQRSAGEHLTLETENAAKLRTEALAEAERIKVEASGEAEKIIDRARHKAAIIDERARQELALRRRQMRDEQELLTRRKHAMLNQLASVSALAVETAENLPDVPKEYDTAFSEANANSGHGSPSAEIESDPTIGNPANEADEQIDDGEADEAAAQHHPGGEAEDDRTDDQSDDSSGQAPESETSTDKPAFAQASQP
jgi:hypothetical protein